MALNNFELFKSNLEILKWKNIQQRSYIGVEFDITASKKMGFGKHKLLVKYFPILDEDTLSAWIKNYNRIDNNTKKLICAHTFTLCIVAELINENALNILSAFPFKTFGSQFSSKGGKGIALIVDYQSKLIYGRKPGLSIPFKKIFKNLIECIGDTYQIYEIRKSPRPEVTFIKMKSDLKKWGFGLMGFGALHIVFASVLDPVWGVILIVVGIGNLLVPHRSLYLVNGFAIMIAAISNMASMGKAGESGVFGILLIFQFILGILEIRKFKLYEEVEWSHHKVSD